MRKIYIGHRLKLWRERRGLSQADLVRRTGFRSGYISEVEGNKKEPGTGALVSIADGLNIPLAALIGRDDLFLTAPISMVSDGDDVYLIDPRHVVLKVSPSGLFLVDIEDVPSTAISADMEHLGRAVAHLLQNQ